MNEYNYSYEINELLSERDKEIERLNNYIVNPRSYIEDCFKDLGKYKKIIERLKSNISYKQYEDYVKKHGTLGVIGSYEWKQISEGKS